MGAVAAAVGIVREPVASPGEAHHTAGRAAKEAGRVQNTDYPKGMTGFGSRQGVSAAAAEVGARPLIAETAPQHGAGVEGWRLAVEVVQNHSENSLGSGAAPAAFRGELCGQRPVVAVEEEGHF